MVIPIQPRSAGLFGFRQSEIHVMSDTTFVEPTSTDLAKPAADEKQQSQWKQRGIFCCAMCGSGITSSDKGIVRQGNHYHDCLNPDGRRFLVACFSEASGCVYSGELIERFSWFRHYRWQFARCRSCHSQLGWHYVGSDMFVGLILEQLVECPQQE